MTFGLSAGAISGIATIGGALLGSQGSNSSQTQQRSMDPRMDRYVYGEDGQGGLLNYATDLMNQQRQNGGMNDLQRGGMEMQRQFLTSPEYTRGYDQMRNQGMGLMGQPVAGNPFTAQGGMSSMFSGGGGLAANPQTPSNFSYQQNPAMQGAYQPLAGPTAQAAAQPAQQPAAVMDPMQEYLRQFYGNSPFYGGGDFGGGSSGDGGGGGSGAY